MPRYFLQLSYDGSAYHGWQMQENANTVQAEIEKGLKTIFQEDIRTTGCGRTDTGVHAKKYFLHFDTGQEPDHENLIYRINRILPDDIAVTNIIPVQDSAHARFDASSREYQYFIHSENNPFLFNYSLLILRKLDVDLMNEAAAELLRQNCYTSFSKLHSESKTDICNVSDAKWVDLNGQLIFTIRADRFLRNMVRALVGTLIEIGERKINLGDFQNIFEAKDRSAAKKSVAARGLFLTDIIYPYI